MIYFSRISRPATISPPVGDGTAPIYEEFFENGTYVLKKTGKDDLFTFVQSSKEETLVYNIISRYQRGDLSALNSRAGQFIDVTGMPTNLAEAHQIMFDVQRKFDSLTPDLKKKFNNDVNVFVDVVSHSSYDDLRSVFGVNNDVLKDGDNNEQK